MATNVKGVLAGRSWLVDGKEASGATAATAKCVSQVERKYLILRDGVPQGTATEETSLHLLTNIPKVGDKHHNGDLTLVVKSIKFDEQEEGEKAKVIATVTYGRVDSSAQEATSSDPACSVEQWGWHAGSVSRDLMGLKTRNNVEQREPTLNSFGDPFDSVPQIDFPSPVFTKVFKTATRISNSIGHLQKVNRGSVTIGGKAFAARTLRCVACDEERLFGDPDYKYRYSVSLQYFSNIVRYYDPNGQDGGQFKDNQEIGWDVAIADLGLRYLNENNQTVRATDVQDDGTEIPASLPVPLDGKGHRNTSTNPQDGIVYLRVKTYPDDDFPSIFYSEPQ